MQEVFEIWKDVPGYEWFYQASNKGNARSVDRYIECRGTMRMQNGKMLKPHIGKFGYKQVILYNKKPKLFKVHRLVAKLFLPNPNNYPCVNHKDENPSNNKVDNLEWCTYSYNLSYGSKTSRELNTKRIQNCKNAPKKVVQKDLYNNVIREFSSANEASRILNIPNSSIIDCCNQKVRRDSKGYLYTIKSAGGYKFSWSNSNENTDIK